jgi:hypothetical protein
MLQPSVDMSDKQTTEDPRDCSMGWALSLSYLFRRTTMLNFVVADDDLFTIKTL